MNHVTGFARSLFAYVQACLVAGTTLFLLSLVLPDPLPGGADELALRFGVTLFTVTLAGTPFALIVLFLLHLAGSPGWGWTIAGGAAAGVMPVVFLSAILGEPFDVPIAVVLIAALSGAAGGAAFYAIASRRNLAS